MIRDVRRGDPQVSDVIGDSVALLVRHVRAQRAHFRFIARERFGGVPVVREAIHHELELFERELATDLCPPLALGPLWVARGKHAHLEPLTGVPCGQLVAELGEPSGAARAQREVVVPSSVGAGAGRSRTSGR